MPNRSAPRAVRAALVGLAALHVAEAIALRRRRNRLAVLHQVPSATDVVGATDTDDAVFVRGNGVHLDDATRAGARKLAAESGRDVLDLVPGDLPANRFLRLLRRVDPVGLRQDPFVSPGGAHQAVLVSPRVYADTCGDEPVPEPTPRGLGELARETVAWQRHAPLRSGIALAPTLAAGPASPTERWRELDQLVGWSKPYLTLSPAALGIEAAHLALMVGGCVVDPVGGALALATWSAQPAAVLAGHPRGQGDRTPEVVKASALRLPQAALDLVRTATAGVQAARRDVQARKLAPPRPVPPTGELFEPRREDCPWCGGDRLRNRITTRDLLQHKAGAFKLDQCDDCGHTFQNPTLSLAGLDHYYDEFYDGQGGELCEFVFGSGAEQYVGRADTVAAHTTPTRWLDVGTGHGHFCLSARQRWPEARFDGLDLSDSIEDAERRGWIDRGFRGLFPELAGGLPTSYDVVSMAHYLEHTRDPRDELDAAAKVLEPGGFLLIEVPDPECRWADRLGPKWFPWFQPQHLNLVPVGNLCEALVERNFEIVQVDRRTANQPVDLVAALALTLEDTIPSPKLPWQPAAPWSRRLARGAMFTAAAPALAVAAGLDQLLHVLNRDDETSNTYRVLARRI